MKVTDRTMFHIMLTGILCVGIAGIVSASIPDVGRPALKTRNTGWSHDLESVQALAQAEYKPVILLFTSPDCPWCSRIKDELRSEEVLPLLEHYGIAEIDVSENPDAAAFYGIRGVPTLLVLSAEGRVRDGTAGFMSREQLKKMLEESLNPEFLKTLDAKYAEIIGMLDDKCVDASRWPEIMKYLGDEDRRKDLREKIIRLDPFPADDIVKMLEHNLVVVRLGALEVLEEVTGDTFGYNPWMDLDSGESNSDALARWRAWAHDSKDISSVYAPLAAEKLESYIRDLVSDNRIRSIRAMQMLSNGGESVAKALEGFSKANSDLPAGSLLRVTEVRYAILLPSVTGVPASIMAHRLVFGNLETRLKAIRDLGAAGPDAMRVLVDFVEDSDPLVRETAFDALLAAGGRRAVPIVEKHVEVEEDLNVLHAVARGLGNIRTKSSLGILKGFLADPNEDLVVVSLESIGRLKTRKAEDEIGVCLEDPRWRVRAAALDVAGKLKLSGLSEKVRKCLHDKDEFVRYSALKAVTVMSERNAVDDLKQLFVEQDSLKGAVVAAFGSLKIDVPMEFAKQIKNASPDVLVAIMEALEDCGVGDLWIAAENVNHENLDVACTAIRAIGMHGAPTPELRAALMGVMDEGRREKVLALLESLRVKDKSVIRMTTIISPSSLSAKASTESESSEVVDDLLSAFTESKEGDTGVTVTVPVDNPEASAGVVMNVLVDGSEARQEEPKDAQVTIDDLFSAFSDVSQPRDFREPGPGAGFDDIVEKVRSIMNDEKDDDLRFQSALLLAKMGCPDAVDCLRDGLDSRTVGQRREIAAAMEGIKSTNSIPLVTKLLNDPSEDVRREVAEACMDHERSRRFLETVLHVLAAADSRLQPEDVHGYRFQSACERGSFRTAMHSWAIDILENDERIPIRIFALNALRHCGRRSDADTIRKSVESESPYERRAAFYTLCKDDSKAVEEFAETIMDDTSELVRAVLPAVTARDGFSWVNYYGESRVSRDYSWSSRSYGRLSVPARNVIQALTELTGDQSPAVRAEAYFALLSNRQTIDLVQFVKTVNTFPDSRAIRARVAEFLADNYKSLGQSFVILLPYLSDSYRNESTLDDVRRHFNIDSSEDEDSIDILSCAGIRDGGKLEASYLDVETQPSASAADRDVALIYFTSPGCRDCARVEKLLEEMQNHVPLNLMIHNIRKVDAMRLNETLCERFGVPDQVRLVTPAVFCSAGYLIKEDIDFAALGRLLARSAAMEQEGWYEQSGKDIEKADSAIGNRYSRMGFWVVLGAGLLDGLNPCAFATIIFFMSYLHVTRRTPGEIAQVGVAFILGVFGAYFVLGLGLVEVIARIEALKGITTALNAVVGLLALVIMALSIRDGIRCLRGRLEDITLQLPSFLKDRIRSVVRTGARQRRFVIAAFVVGVIISFLELACTGQVYAPTILFMLKTKQQTVSALFYLVCYNMAFVTPLIIIFLLVYSGMKAEALIRFMRRHAATVKFATAFLFLVLFLALVFGERLGADVSLPTGTVNISAQP